FRLVFFFVTFTGVCHKAYFTVYPKTGISSLNNDSRKKHLLVSPRMKQPNRIFMIRSAMSCVRKAVSCSIFFVLLLSFTALSQNPIVTENALPGNPISEWGVPDFRDNRI